ncbi:MAG: GNAT family N-acetyltransferase [Anaerolineales bacterium]
MDEIRAMNPGDISSVVEVHLASFQGFFLSSLGARFLNEFYRCVLLDETHIAFVCLNEDTISGFVVGTAQPAGFYRRTLKSNWSRFILASAPPVLKNPIMALRLLKRLIMVKGTAFDHGQALLMSIAVDPDEQGKGIGNLLLAAFLRESKSRGLLSVLLTTDAVNNESVNGFYLHGGFRLSRVYITPEKRQMNEYVYEMSILSE